MLKEVENIGKLKRLIEVDCEWTTLYPSERFELECIINDLMLVITDTNNKIERITHNKNAYNICELETIENLKDNLKICDEIIAIYKKLTRRYTRLLNGKRRDLNFLIKYHKIQKSVLEMVKRDILRSNGLYETEYDSETDETVETDETDETVETECDFEIVETVETVETEYDFETDNRIIKATVKRTPIKKANHVRMDTNKNPFFKEKINQLKHINIELDRKIAWLEKLDINDNILNEYILNTLKMKHHVNDCMIEMYIGKLNCKYTIL